MNIDISKVRPIGERIVVEVHTVSDETASGLVLSDTSSNSAPVIGKVVRVSEQSTYKPGQIVLFRRFAVDELKFNDSDASQKVLNMVEESEILGVLEE